MSRHPFNRYKSLASLIVAMSLGIPAWGASLSFALFGDVYMTPEHHGYLKGMLDDMANKNEALAIFTGGIKPAEQGCQDSNLLAAYPVFARAPLPTIYVPGDTDWATCAKFSPEERLNLLRRTYYQSDRSLGDPSLPLLRQETYPELMRWQTGPALFVTLNVTVSDDESGQKTEAHPETQARNNAALQWLQDAFTAARQGNVDMLVIVMHGAPAFDTSASAESPNGYLPLINLLKTETGNYTGQVLLVHGGSGVHRIDHPLRNSNGLPHQNFTRVETYGALQQGWVQVEVIRNQKTTDDGISRTEFRFESFPWPPLTLGDETVNNPFNETRPGQ